MGRKLFGSRLERERCEDGLGKQYCTVAAGVAVAGVAGAAMSADAAGDAADAQSAASREASQMEMMMANQTRQDLAPWTQAGGAAQQRLNQYLGIGGAGSGGVTSLGLQTGLTPDQVRQQLLSRYTRTVSPTGAPTGSSTAPQYRTGQEAVNALGAAGAAQYFQNRPRQPPGAVQGAGLGPGYWVDNNSATGQREWVSTQNAQPSGPSSTIDEDGLNAAIAKYYEEQNAQNAAAQADPTYGSLLRAYRNGEEFDSGPAFSFTGEDLASEPGYQFGLNQGTQGIERGQASRGNFLSGAAMKELNRFNQDYAGTKFNDAFNRSLTGYNTNLTRRQNEWNTNLGAYTNHQDRVYNFLSGVSTLGQNSAARVGASNQQVGSSVAGNLLASGAAQSAGAVVRGNALQSGINQAANAFNSSNNLNSAGAWNNLLAQGGGGYSGYTGYTGGNDPLGGMISANGWTG